MVDSTITLYKDVGLSPDYSRTMDFTTKTEQKAWFASLATPSNSITITANYNKIQNSFVIHEEVGDVYGYSYVRIQDIDNSGREYYGFITNVELVDDETTRFDILLDVIQTFMTEWEIGPSFVLREHIDRWIGQNNIANLAPNTDKFNTNNTVSQTDVINNNKYAVVVVAFSSDKYYTAPSEGNRDKIYYGYTIVNTKDYTDTLYGIRPVREVNVGEGGAHTERNAYMDAERYLTIDEITSGFFLNSFNIDPASIVSISIVPIANVVEVPMKSSISVTFPAINGGVYKATGGHQIKLNAPEYTTNLTVRNIGGAGNVIYWGDISVNQKMYQGGSDTVLLTYEMCPSEQTDITDTGYASVGFPIFPLIYNIPDIDKYKVDITLDIVDGPITPDNGDVTVESYEPNMCMSPIITRKICDYKGNTIMDIPDILALREGNLSNDFSIEVRPLFDVSGMRLLFLINNSLNVSGPMGGVAEYICDTIPFVNDAWLSYKLTSLDTDRSNAKMQAMATLITNGIYGAYGGALVGSRSASGYRDDAETRNTLLKRGAIGASIVGGLSSVAAGAVNAYVGWETQKNKEKVIQNQASQITLGTNAISYLSDKFRIYVITLRCDTLNYGISFNNYRYYGKEVSCFKVPDIRSRKYYNYLITQGCVITGALNANIKQEIAKVFDSGVTIFHADYCDTTEYPTNSTGDEYENIERSLM